MAHWLAASAVASSFIELGSSNVPSFSAELESSLKYSQIHHTYFTACIFVCVSERYIPMVTTGRPTIPTSSSEGQSNRSRDFDRRGPRQRLRMTPISC